MKTILTIGRLTFGIAVSLVLAAKAFGQPSPSATESLEEARYLFSGRKSSLSLLLAHLNRNWDVVVFAEFRRSPNKETRRLPNRCAVVIASPMCGRDSYKMTFKKE